MQLCPCETEIQRGYFHTEFGGAHKALYLSPIFLVTALNGAHLFVFCLSRVSAFALCH